MKILTKRRMQYGPETHKYIEKMTATMVGKRSLFLETMVGKRSQFLEGLESKCGYVGWG
jgi:hypothetical protein